MTLFTYFTTVIIISAFVHCDDINNKLDDNPSSTNVDIDDVYLTMSQAKTVEVEKVDVKVYYETLCPYCINFFVEVLQEEIPKLHEYLNIHLYPYGNAKTKQVDDHYEFTCQHGEKECYGNKLHACAIDILKNLTKSTLYNCCLMHNRSDDNAATECGTLMKIEGNSIKECAKSDKASQLLKYYGDETTKAKFRGVPYILVNDKKSLADSFKRDVCQAFINPPPACKTIEIPAKHL